MYKYHRATPIEIKLTDESGFLLRQKVADILDNNLTKGAEKGSKEEQSFGLLAELVIRSKVGLPEIKEEDHPLGFDILLASGIKVDVKCRGGKMPFREIYVGADEIGREAKHNFFARQLYDLKLDADIYLMTHLEHPNDPVLPGTKRQKKWILYVCGWVSKERAIREGVYLPRGSITEQGNTWFPYRGQEIEFYNRNLNGLSDLKDILLLEKDDLEVDIKKKGDLNLTSVDALRIAYDLVGRGVLTEKHVEFIKQKLSLTKNVSSILHPNQYYHLVHWLRELNQVGDLEIEKLAKVMKKKNFEGI